MKAWFESLEQRERMFLSAGAAIVVVALFYALIWLPLDRNHDNLSASVADWQRSLEQLGPLKGLQPATGTNNRVAGAQKTPVVIVDQTLRARGLYRSLQRSQPTTGNGIRVEFENAAFDDLVLWLGDLSNQYGMDVASGSVSVPNRGDKGRVNATLVLERAL